MPEFLIGTEQASNNTKRTQTYIATHDGAGNRLPLMERSFMSFMFGGKYIEDFQLIVTMNNGLSRNLYAEFEDITSEYTTIDGQYYWGTRMRQNTLDFTLSTDYITDSTLEEFKYWFKPGVERDLILVEHPNRYIRARVAAPPTIDMVPFGEETNYYINQNGEKVAYKTKTTTYRGDIELSFVMCEPYWTGILNYMPYPGCGIIENENNQRIVDLLKTIININSLESKEALKICLEDGIPHDKNLYADDYVNLGIDDPYINDILLAVVPGLYTDSNTTRELEASETDVNDVPPLDSNQKDQTRWAVVSDSNPTTYLSYIKTAITDISHVDTSDAILGYILTTNRGIDLDENVTQYLFYSGTAPSKPKISFILYFYDNEEGYIVHPHNSIGTPNEEPSYIKVGKNYFKFTTPSICTMYNKGLQLLNDAKQGGTISESIFEFRQRIRETIKNKYVKQWLLYCISDLSNEDRTSEVIDDEIINEYKTFFIKQTVRVFDYDTNTTNIEDEYHGEFEFNSETGEAIGKFYCMRPADLINEDNEIIIKDENESDIEDQDVLKCQITENVGDMVLSKYLIIDERNYLVDGRILLENCTPIESNEKVNNLKIIYNNKYY